MDKWNRILIAALAMFTLTACNGLNQAHVIAEAKTYNAVAPEYAELVLESDKYDVPGEQRRLRTLQAWERGLKARMAQSDVDIELVEVQKPDPLPIPEGGQ